MKPKVICSECGEPFEPFDMHQCICDNCLDQMETEEEFDVDNWIAEGERSLDEI